MSLTFGCSTNTTEKQLKGLIFSTLAHFKDWSFYAQLYMFRKLSQTDFSTEDIISSEVLSTEQPCMVGLIKRWSAQHTSGALAEDIFSTVKASLKATLAATFSKQPADLQRAFAKGMAELGIESAYAAEGAPPRFR